MLLRRVRIGLLLGLASTSAAWASQPPLWLERNEIALDGGVLVLGIATLVLAAGEVSTWRKQKEVTRLALAVEQQRIEMLEQRAIAEEAAAKSAPALNPLMAGRSRPDAAPRPTSAPPPPPPSFQSSSSAPAAPPAPAFMPPPPPPLPAAGGEAGNPFARLAALGAESDESAKKISGSKPSPISLPTAPPEGPPATESGGWADLMQKVRSAKESEGSPPPLTSMPAPPRPPAEAPKAGGGDAWEALLKKTAAASTSDNPFAGSDNPFANAVPPESGNLKSLLSGNAPQGAANPFAGLSGGGGGSTPAPPPPPPAEAPADPLPDFIRKASRTISLDSFKSGEGKL